MDQKRYEEGKALYARRLQIPPEEVPAYFARRVGTPFGQEAILAAPGAWADGVLSLRDRSLMVITALITQGGANEQLRSHVHLAVLHGCTRAELEAMGPLLAVYAGQPRAGSGLTVVMQALAELDAAAASPEAAPARGGQHDPQ